MKKYILLIVFLFGYLGISQEEVEKQKAKDLEVSKNYTWNANKNLSEDKFVDAEAEYRKAISKSSENATAPYNLGNAYYKKETYSEAFGRFKQAGEVATNKADKHKAYHNMGNVFMKRKEYEKAVEAYKEALRNNPKDEETRYNLALAKEMLKKQQDEQKNDQNQDQDKNQDQKDQDNKDQQDKNKDKKDGEDENKGDKDKEQDKKEGDEGDKGDEGEDKKEDNKQGEGDDKKEDNKKPNQEGEPEQQKQQPRPNQLSKQQVQNLLEAMQNEEKKVKDKVDAKKIKGVKVRNEKDW